MTKTAYKEGYAVFSFYVCLISLSTASSRFINIIRNGRRWNNSVDNPLGA